MQPLEQYGRLGQPERTAVVIKLREQPSTILECRAMSEQLIRAEPMGLQGASETCRNKATKAVLM